MRTVTQRLEDADPAFVKSLMKLVTGISFFVVLIVLISFLPGADRVIPSIPLTLGAAIIAIGTVALVGVIVQIAPQIESLLTRTIPDEELAPPVGRIGRFLVLFVAVLVAYHGLRSAFRPFLLGRGFGPIFDIAFLILGIIPLAYVGYHLYCALDPLARIFACSLTGADDVDNIADENTLPTFSIDGDRWRSVAAGMQFSRPPLTILSEAMSRPSGSAVSPEQVQRQEIEPVASDQELIDHVPPEFLSNEDRVLRLLEVQGGRMKQTDIVAKTGWSKSKVSRVLSEMESNDQIVRVDIGRGNVVTRPDDLPSGAKSLLKK